MRGCENPGRKDPPGGKVSDATAGQLHEQVPCPGLGWGLVCIRYCQGVSKGWRSGVGVYAVSCSGLSFQEGQNFSAGAGAVRPGVG